MATSFKRPIDTFITPHAALRFAERFPSLDIQSELENAVAWGVQKDAETLLSLSGAVFVVRHNTVVTVLTKQQAQANASMVFGIDFSCELSDEPIKPRKGAKRFAPQTLDAIDAIAKKHINENVYGISKQHKRIRRTDFRAAGFDCPGEEWDYYQVRLRELLIERGPLHQIQEATNAKPS